MKRLLLEDLEKFTIDLVSDFSPKNKDEIILKVSHCGLCKTDAKMWKKGHRDLVLPRVLGHEICGYFENDRHNRFVVWPGKSCGNCKYCLDHKENLCVKMEIFGFHRHGGLSEYIPVLKKNIIPIPNNLPGSMATLAEPLACGLNAIELAKIDARDNVLVYGGGTLGILMALGIIAKSAIPTIVEPNFKKLKKSESFRKYFKVKSTALESELKATSYDCVINATSCVEVFNSGIPKLKSNGSYCLFSGFTKKASFSSKLINEIHYKQLHLLGAYGCTRKQMKKGIEILNQYKDQLDFLIEKIISIEDVPANIEDVLSGNLFKLVVKV